MAALRVSASEIFRLNHWFQSGPASAAAAAWKSGGGSGWKTMPTEASTSMPVARGLKSFTSHALRLAADRRTPATGPTKTGSVDGGNLGEELERREPEARSGFGERDEEGAELHGLEAVGDLAMLPCSRDLHHAELRRAAPSRVEFGFAEDTAVIGVAVDGSVIRDGTLDAELVHGHHEAEPAARTEHGHDRAHGSVHVAHMLEDGERVGEVEAAGLEVLVHFFRQPLTKRRGARAIEPPGDLHVGR